MSIATTRMGVALSVSVAVAASVAGTAGARIPDGGGTATMQPELTFSDFNLGLRLPVNSGLSSIDAWISERMTRGVRAQEASFATPDAVARALARRNR